MCQLVSERKNIQRYHCHIYNMHHLHYSHLIIDSSMLLYLYLKKAIADNTQMAKWFAIIAARVIIENVTQ